MASPFTQPDFTSQTATEYKTAIDDSIAVVARLAGAFSAQAQDTPDMTVHVNAGPLWDGSTLTEVAAQDTGTITAPSTDDRIDRVVIDATDGSVSVVTGTEATSPSAPSIPSGKLPCAQVALTAATTEITNSDITDERADVPRGGIVATTGGGSFPNVTSDVTASHTELNGVSSTGRWILLDTQTASSSSSLDFTSGLDGSYSRYMFVLEKLHASMTTSLYARTTTDGGSSWDSGASYYQWSLIDSIGNTSSSTGDDKIVVTDSFSDGNLTKGEVVIDDLGGGGEVSFDNASMRADIHSTRNRVWTGGATTSSDTINGVRFFPDSGSISGGEIHLYGWNGGS